MREREIWTPKWDRMTVNKFKKSSVSIHKNGHNILLSNYIHMVGFKKKFTWYADQTKAKQKWYSLTIN